jgi:hypothetical protein
LRLICVEKIFQKAARPGFEVFAIKPNFPPPLTLLGFKPTKHRSTPMASLQGAAGASKFIETPDSSAALTWGWLF